ncbi:MAG: hypothetical protein NTY02_18740 [Acidobacteria bacterium]|nr:hypothetical protein [Acidobacteriota bacterium]
MADHRCSRQEGYLSHQDPSSGKMVSPEAGMWKDYPGDGRATKGVIGLPDFDNRVRFLDITIRSR